MSNVKYFDKEEYSGMELVKMQSNHSHHESLFVNEHIFHETQNNFHRHEYMQIDYVSEGNGLCEFEDGVSKFTQGSCFIIPPYVPHRIILSPNVKNIKIYEVEFLVDFIFPPSREISDMEAYADFICLGLKEGNNTETSKHIINLTGSLRDKVEGIISDALSEYKNRDVGYETVLRSLILQLLTILGRKFSLTSENDDIRYEKHKTEILNAIDYIHKNYEKNVTLEELSHLANYSPSYFSSLFKSITSKSYLSYLNNYRIRKSMELLKNTDMLVIDIAQSVGFENVTNYNRIFKKLIGMSPMQYRKLN